MDKLDGIDRQEKKTSNLRVNGYVKFRDNPMEIL
jgi:hypothetical protein